MKNGVNQTQSYYLSPVWRIAIIGIAIVFLCFGGFILFSNWISGTVSNAFPGFVFNLAVAGLLIFSSFRIRLVISSDGLVEHYVFWPRRYIPWIYVDSIQGSSSNSLVLKIKRKSNNSLENELNTLPINQYCRGVEVFSFLELVKRFAPEIEIPEGLNPVTPIPVLSHPGSIGMYYFFSLLLVLAIPLASHNLALSPIVLKVGEILVWGISFSLSYGVVRLAPFLNWIPYLENRGEFKKTARDFYLLPITGGLLAGAMAGIVALGGITPLEEYRGILIFIAAFLSYNQQKLLFPKNPILKIRMRRGIFFSHPDRP